MAPSNIHRHCPPQCNNWSAHLLITREMWGLRLEPGGQVFVLLTVCKKEIHYFWVIPVITLNKPRAVILCKGCNFTVFVVVVVVVAWFNIICFGGVSLSQANLFNTFDDSLPMQMPISTQRKLRLLVLLQKKYLYTCKNIVTKPNLEEFLRKLFEQYRIENCGKPY